MHEVLYKAQGYGKCIEHFIILENDGYILESYRPASTCDHAGLTGSTICLIAASQHMVSKIKRHLKPV